MKNISSIVAPFDCCSVATRQVDGGLVDRSVDRYARHRFHEDVGQHGEGPPSMTEEMFAVVAHELRTPLDAVANWARALRRAPDDGQDVLRAAAAIERSVIHQARIVDDLLDVSRIMAGKFELVRSEQDLDEVVQESLATVQHAASAKQIRLRCEASESVRVLADARRLQQVLVNLLMNAIKFTASEGDVSIRLFRRRQHAVIRVMDTGQGIAAELLPLIFERFRQAKAPEERRGGIGLGLNIVKNLVELHGGSVHVESAGPGRGAAFTVCLPCVMDSGS